MAQCLKTAQKVSTLRAKRGTILAQKTILLFSKKMIFFSDFQAQCSGCMYERSSQEKCDARGIFIHHYHSA